MKKVFLIAVALFLTAFLISPMTYGSGPQSGSTGGPPPAKAPADGPEGKAPAGPGGPEGKAPGKAPEKAKAPTHEEFVKMYDKNGDGVVSLEEFVGE